MVIPLSCRLTDLNIKKVDDNQLRSSKRQSWHISFFVQQSARNGSIQIRYREPAIEIKTAST